MSRIANKPVEILSGVELKVDGHSITFKGKNGEMTLDVNDKVSFTQEDSVLKFSGKENVQDSVAMAGTMRSLASNMIAGVTKDYEKKLQLVGVGYVLHYKVTSWIFLSVFLILYCMRFQKV